MKAYTLDDGLWRLDVVPGWGGRISRLRVAGRDLLLPIQTDEFDPLAWPKGGAYPLVPYSNRLRNAQLTFAGRTYDLPAHPAALPHSLHGIAHTLPWRVEQYDENSLTLVCQYSGEHWPWPFTARQHFRLEEGGLLIELQLTNDGASAMPAGLGLHPYFARRPGMRISVEAGLRWPLDEDYLPTGISHPLPEGLRFDSATTQQEMAHYLSQWSGCLQIDYPQGSLRMTAGEVLSHFIVFAPGGAPYVCLEPVSHLADGFNREAEVWPEVGVRSLAPGATLREQIAWRWQPA